MRHYNAVVRIELPDGWAAEMNPEFRQVAGCFINIGVWAEDEESAARLGAHDALYGEPRSGWFPPQGSTVASCEIERTLVEAPEPCEPGVVFRSGFIFYPRRRWWQFWR
jgi:hypothetical protein